MNPGPASVVTFGEAMFRMTVPDHGRLATVDALLVDVAGAELNVAVALASLGVPTSWISAVPDSPIGRRVEAAAASAGVNIGSVASVADARLGVFYVESGLPPRPIAVWYDRRGSAFAQQVAFDFGPLAGARFAVVSGITPGLGPTSAAATRQFVTAAQANAAEICLDVNYRERLWTVEAARAGMADLLAAAGVVVCSERDARRVFDCQGTPDEVLRGLARRCCPQARIVVLTLGSEGALGLADGELHRQPAFEATVVDRFGAGDAFTAGLLWGLLDGGLDQALKAGAALAALKCSVRGDLARFTRAELEALLAGEGSQIRR